MFLIGDRENLHEIFFLRAQALARRFELSASSLTQFLVHKHRFHNLVLGHVGEYSRATCILAPFFLTPPSFNITSALFILHPKLDGFLLVLKKKLRTKPRPQIFI
jgi:hypothetical protein